VRVLALDHGRARTGVAVSDPTGTLAAPLPAIARVDSPAGRARLDALIAELSPERILVGEPRLLSGARGEQARAARAFAERLRTRVAPPVELVDERLSTAEAERRRREGAKAARGEGRRSRREPARRRESGARADLDSLAACVLLESYLAARR